MHCNFKKIKKNTKLYLRWSAPGLGQEPLEPTLELVEGKAVDREDPPAALALVQLEDVHELIASDTGRVHVARDEEEDKQWLFRGRGDEQVEVAHDVVCGGQGCVVNVYNGVRSLADREGCLAGRTVVDRVICEDDGHAIDAALLANSLVVAVERDQVEDARLEGESHTTANAHRRTGERAQGCKWRRSVAPH